MKKTKTGSLVYSTDSGRMCPECRSPANQCRCRKTTHPVGDGIVRVSRQTKGRKGSGVCIISGLPLGHEDLKALAQQLKKQCGSGGTIKNGAIEIQGDHRAVLVDTLVELGYTAKSAGG